MRIVTVVLSAILFVACGQSNSGGDVELVGVVNDEFVVPKKWKASPFDPSKDTVEANDLELFFEHFKMNSDALHKGEFETTEEHEARIAHVEAYGAFVNDRPYAVTVAKGSQLGYDADNELFYPLVNRLCSYFDFPYTINKDKQAACALGRKLDGIQEYYGHSVSSAMADMARVAEIRFHFVVPISSSGISKSSSVPGAYHLKGVCAMERHKAEALSGKLGFAYLITLNKPSLVRGLPDFEGPSSRPAKVTFNEGIDVGVSGYICYELDSNLIVSKVLF